MTSGNEYNKIAIVGSGIAGLTAAHLLHPKYDITIFEKSTYLGGHSNTETVRTPLGVYKIDTGFIVFNHQTYPNFTKLLNKLNVPSQSSNMSFSFHSDLYNLEYGGDSINSLFAQRKNFFNVKFHRLLRDILSFNKSGKKFLKQNRQPITLKAFVESLNSSPWFYECYLKPLAAAIWSTPPTEINDMPAEFLLEFYNNHGLLSVTQRPEWLTVKGGSQEYVKALTKAFSNQTHLNTEVKAVIRNRDHVSIQTVEGEHKFDAVVIACHSDEALKILHEPTSDETDILSAIPYQENKITLHTDTNLLPKNKRAWSSWNYRQTENKNSTLTYYMNKLQNINSSENFCVSVNESQIDPKTIIKEYTYAHPTYNRNTLEAKNRHGDINNKKRCFFVGAYWGYGFHEDGVNSALAALADLELYL